MSASSDSVGLSRHAEPRRLGLNQVFPDRGDSSSRTDIDIIAIHGLDTQSPNTWASWKKDGDPTSGEVHWLQDRDMLPRVIPNARIFTYDWNANFSHSSATDLLLGHADGLLDRLHIYRYKDSSNRPIIFIASCFGGLLLVKALHRALEVREYQGILRSTVGIAFLGTPFQGSHDSFYTAAQLRIAVAMQMGGEGSNELAKYLRDDVGGRGELDELIQRFCEMVEDDEFKIPMVCFYETQRSDFTRVMRNLPPEFARQLYGDNTGILVPRYSACLQGPRRFGLDVRHAMLNKYTGPEDDAFIRVSFRLKEFVSGAQKTLQAKDSSYQKGHWLVPFGRNEGFVGRESILQRLLERIPPSSNGDTCQRTAIEGLGGIGKTQIALEAAFRLRNKYPDCSVFWVPAVDITTFENAYREVGRYLGIVGIDQDKADIKALVKATMSCENIGKWLLIVDNADDMDLFFGPTGLSDYLPFSRTGSILFTTRNHEAVVRLGVTEQGTIVTAEMNRTEATELLQRSLKENQVYDTASTTSLLDFLANLPLAIKQASAYMAWTRMTTTKYLDHYRSSDKNMITLLSRDFEDLSRYKGIRNPITTTWLISFRHMSRDNQLATQYLKFMSFLAEKEIPKSLLPHGNNELEADEALGILKAYAFITERAGQESYDIHTLVRLAMRNWLVEEGELKASVTRVIQRLHMIFPYPKYENRVVWARYLPHALTALEFREDSTDKIAESSILTRVGWCYIILGKYEKAEQINRQALEMKEKVLGKEHPSTLTSMNNVAEALRYQGKYEDAGQMHRRTLELNKKVRGKEHPDTLGSMSNIAVILRKQGKYEDAEQMHRQILELREKVLGKEHPNILDSMGNLALVLKDQGKYEDAGRIHRRTLELNEKIRGKEHPDTLSSMNNVAVTLSSQGKYEDAEPMHRQILELREKVLGKEHPDTLDSMNNIAVTLKNQGKYKDAERIHRQILELREKVLGKEHPSISDSMNNLALVLWRQGKYKEAEQIHRQALKQRQQVLGKENPHTLDSMNNLASVLESQGKYEEAEQMYLRVLELREKVLGDEHPTTVKSRNRFAGYLRRKDER